MLLGERIQVVREHQVKIVGKVIGGTLGNEKASWLTEINNK
ncbi:hypothetical protein ACQKNB_12935 [Lysinibacillus xylanilyticus]